MQFFRINYSQSKSHQKNNNDNLNNINAEADLAITANDHGPDLYINRTTNLFNDFVKTHTKELQNVKAHAKRLAEETQNLKLEIIEKDVMIESLNETIEAKTHKIAKYEEEQIKLKASYEEARKQGQESHLKYCELEVTYDKNLSDFENENVKLKENIEMHKNAHIKLMEEFAAIRNELQSKLVEKSEECAAINDKFLHVQSNLEEHKEKLTNLQNSFDTYKVERDKVHEENKMEMSDEYELKIANLNVALQQKENLILKIRKEKLDMEDAKNAIIDEQSIRISRIENAFTQPLVRVKSSQQQNRKLTVNDEEQLTRIATATTTANIVHANHVTQTQSQSTAVAEILQSHRFLAPSENYSSTEDEGSILSNWHPNVTSNHATNRGFILRKRPFVRENTIPETSESDNVEQPWQAKRAKN